MLTIELTGAELVLIADVMKGRQTALLNELVHTDDRELRASIRESLAAIERLHAKVEGYAGRQKQASAS